MANAFLRSIKEFRYNANRIFKVLKDPEGSTYFPEELRKSKFSMWRDNIRWLAKHGEANVFYFVYGLDRKNGRDENELLSWKEFKQHRNRSNQKLSGKTYNYVCLLQDKFVFSQFLASLDFPAPKNLAILSNKEVTWLNTMQTLPLSSLVEDTGMNIDGFAKKISGILGAGAFTLRLSTGKLFSKEAEMTLEELKEKLDGEYLLQEKIIQHPEMARLHPSSVNTIRMVTFNNGGNVEIFSTVLRIGARGKTVDNWASGGIIVSIDKERGTLGKEGMFKIGYGGRVTAHPDSGVVFEGFQIPFFEESRQLACRLHRYFYGIHSIGWDIGITPDGPIFIEGNDDWDGAIPMALEQDFRKRYLKMFQKEKTV